MREQKIPFHLLAEPLVIISLKLVEDKDSKGSDLLVSMCTPKSEP